MRENVHIVGRCFFLVFFRDMAKDIASDLTYADDSIVRVSLYADDDAIAKQRLGESLTAG